MTKIGEKLTENNKHILSQVCSKCEKVNVVDPTLEECCEWECWSCGGYLCNIVGEKTAREARKKWAKEEEEEETVPLKEELEKRDRELTPNKIFEDKMERRRFMRQHGMVDPLP